MQRNLHRRTFWPPSRIALRHRCLLFLHDPLHHRPSREHHPQPRYGHRIHLPLRIRLRLRRLLVFHAVGLRSQDQSAACSTHRHVSGGGDRMARHFQSRQMGPLGISTISWKFYLIFCICTPLAAVFTFFFIKETKGLSLQEIDSLFAKPGHKAELERTLRGAGYDGPSSSEFKA